MNDSGNIKEARRQAEQRRNAQARRLDAGRAQVESDRMDFEDCGRSWRMRRHSSADLRSELSRLVVANIGTLASACVLTVPRRSVGAGLLGVVCSLGPFTHASKSIQQFCRQFVARN